MYDCITKYRSSLLRVDLNVMLVGKFDDVHDVQQEHAVFQCGRWLWMYIMSQMWRRRSRGTFTFAGSCNNLRCVNRQTPSNLRKILVQTPVVGDLQRGSEMLKMNVIFSLRAACGSLLQTTFSVSVAFQHDTVRLLKKKRSPVKICSHDVKFNTSFIVAMPFLIHRPT